MSVKLVAFAMNKLNNFILSVTFVSQLFALEYSPRKLTENEIKVGNMIPINSLMTSKSSNASMERIQLKSVPKGTNQEKSWKDAVRMPGTNWCGKGWIRSLFSRLTINIRFRLEN